MRNSWKRTAAGLLLAGVAGTATLALAQPAEHEPAKLPVSSPYEMPLTTVAVVPVQASEVAPRTDPSVALEWSGPAVVKVKQPAEYTLTVRNVCGQPLQKVVVQARTPNDVTVMGTSPAAN